MKSVEICITLRDGVVEFDVLVCIQNACSCAREYGIDFDIQRAKDPYNVATCRNKGVAGFLGRDKTHLLFVDADVLLEPTAIVELVKRADEAAVITGCIPAARYDDRGNLALYVQARPFNAPWLATWPDADIPVQFCGGGCMLIERSVFAGLKFPWFRCPESYVPGVGVQTSTDDSYFCWSVQQAGHQILAAHTVRCGHKKTVDLRHLVKQPEAACS